MNGSKGNENAKEQTRETAVQNVILLSDVNPEFLRRLRRFARDFDAEFHSQSAGISLDSVSLKNKIKITYKFPLSLQLTEALPLGICDLPLALTRKISTE